jgi:galacturan 1,4-alpha-galacturonidase
MKTFRLSSVLCLLYSITNVLAGGVNVTTDGKIQTCTVTANGNQKDDVPHIMQAFKTCGVNGIIVFPEDQTYWIATKLNPVLSNVEVEWRGLWQVRYPIAEGLFNVYELTRPKYSADLAYWRNNSYPIAFQNHHAGFIITGDRIHINGYGTGGINGNGNVWYNAEQNFTQPGRPMPFVFWNVSEVSVQNFYVKDPQLWSLNIMNGTNMYFSGISCNATAVNAPFGKNWVQNTDGFGERCVSRSFLRIVADVCRHYGRQQHFAGEFRLSRR